MDGVLMREVSELLSPYFFFVFSTKLRHYNVVQWDYFAWKSFVWSNDVLVDYYIAIFGNVRCENRR